MSFDYSVMAVQLIFKNSAVKDQKPSPGAITKGEIALNSHEQSAGLFLKDTSGAIQQVGGVAIQNDAPGSPVRGSVWLKRDDLTLRVHDGTAWQRVAGSSSGGGGGTTTIIAADGLSASRSGDEYTLSFDFDANKGLGIESAKAVVKLGAGLEFDAGGNIQAINPPLNYEGIVDLTSATVPAANPGDFYSSSTGGSISSEWGAVITNASAGDSTAVGDLVTYNGTDWSLIPTGGAPGATNLSNTPSANDVVVESSTGADTTIAAATRTTAGVMTASDKAAIDGDFVLLEDGGTRQDITGGGGLTTDGLLEAGGGIKITGGLNDAAYRPGIVSTNGTNLRLMTGDSALGFARGDYSYAFLAQISSTFSVGMSMTAEDLRKFNPNAGDLSVNMWNAKTDRQDLANVSNVDCYIAQFPQPTGQTNLPTTSITGFTARPTTTGFEYGDPGLLFTGFKSSLQRATNFNFLANGDSPNFFKGNTYVGGSTARNTLETWLSTLTEEQEEKYRTGTFIAPADVAEPGDGKWMRQWWYDQQTPEEQALIDAGELAYPTNLLPENFTDTFTLGDLTKIDLEPSNSRVRLGAVEFKGNGTSTTTRSRGIVYSSTLNALLATNRVETTGSNIAAFYARVDPFRMDVDGNLQLDEIGIATSYRSNFPLAGADAGSSGRFGGYVGFFAEQGSNIHYDDMWTGANDIIAFQSSVRAATKGSSKAYNLYIQGTAPNYIAAPLGLGTDDPDPNAQLDVNGDILCSDKNKGVILVSPNNTQYRLTVANDGTLSTSAV